MTRGGVVVCVLMAAGCGGVGSSAPRTTQATAPVTSGSISPTPSSAPPTAGPPVAPVGSVATPAPPPPPAFEFDVDAPSWSSGPLFLACDQPVNGRGAWTPDAIPLVQDRVIVNRWVGTVAVFSGTVPVTSGTAINFKVTRGLWNKVEKGPLGEEVSNRVAVCGSGPTKVFAHVFHWADDQILPPAGAPIRDLGFFMPRSLSGLKRQVYAHLPPGYDDPRNAGTSYPVLYALEGQTMFDPSRSPTGKSLALDKAADGVASVHSFIVVAIDSTFERVYEYGPSFDPAYGAGGRLEDFSQWLLVELKPEVDRVYRTKPGPETTGVLGTGLSGLAAFRLAWRHSDRVRLVASLSPLMGWNNEETKGIVAAGPKPHLVISLDVGTGEGVAQLGYVKNVDTALTGIGFAGDLRYVEVPGGTAVEASWGARLPGILSFLFP